MATRKSKQQAWEERWAEERHQLAEQIGWTPGAAAEHLGISRQAVHKAIRRGDLEATVLRDPETGLKVYVIDNDSLRAFAELRANRDG